MHNSQELWLQMKNDERIIMKTVPEGVEDNKQKRQKTVVKMSEEEQIAYLHEKLAGNKVFGRCRGNFRDLPFGEFVKRGKSSNPTQALKFFDKWCSDRRIMLNLLVVLKRDGQGVAYRELEKVLCDRDYVMTGEDVPLEQRESGVLIVPDPEKTFLVARWMYTSRIEDGISWVSRGEGQYDRGNCGSLTPRLLEMFPNLRGIFIKNPNCSCLDSPTMELNSRIKEIWERLLDKFPRCDVLNLFVDSHRSENFRYKSAVAIFVKKATQSDVLKLFSREEQKTIATWGFDYPTVMTDKLCYNEIFIPDIWIGFHPEDEHSQWKKQWPSFVSRGVVSGLGAVIIDKDMLGEADFCKNKSRNKYEPLFGPYPNHCHGDLMKRHFVLKFIQE